MNVRDIKLKAKEFNKESRMLLFRVFAIITLIVLIKNEIFAGFPLVYFILSILFLTFDHGTIVCLLKVVHHRENEFDFPREVFAGVIRFKELFWTYLSYSLIQGIVIIVISIIGIVLLFVNGLFNLEMWESFLAYDVSQQAFISDAQMTYLSSVLGLIMLLFILVMIFCIWYYMNYGMTFYLLEKYNLKGLEAMKKSKAIMKGYKMLYFKVILSFIPIMLLFGLLFSVVIAIIPALEMVGQVFLSLIMIYFVSVDMGLCATVIFEEACISHYEQIKEGVE